MSITTEPNNDIRTAQEIAIDALIAEAERIKSDLTLSKNVRNSLITAVWEKISELQH